MKKTIFAIAVINILMITSCKKAGDNSAAGGSWTINSVTYQAATCTGNLYGNTGTLTAQDQSVVTLLVVSFPSTLPTTSGTYTVVANANATTGNYISFLMDGNTLNTNGYASTGGNGNETVQVTVAGGKVSLTGTGISMSIPGTPADSTTMSFNIKQTQ